MAEIEHGWNFCKLRENMFGLLYSFALIGRNQERVKIALYCLLLKCARLNGVLQIRELVDPDTIH